MEVEIISDRNLEDVSGGYAYSITKNGTFDNVKLSQKEFDELKEAKIIGEDGNLYYKDVNRAVNYLKRKGYDGSVKVRIRGNNNNFKEVYNEVHECIVNNPPVKLRIV